MIGYLKGIVSDMAEGVLILDVGGVGFELRMSGIDIAKLPGIGEECRVYTHMAVKEDDITLYGFYSKDEKEIFRLLITVNGIGPKGAQQILSAMSAEDLRFAILTGDAKAISRAPGVGMKTAQKAILELKDKLGDLEPEAERDAGQIELPGLTDARGEAVLALMALGYTSTEANRAVKLSDPSLTDPNDILKDALKYIS